MVGSGVGKNKYAIVMTATGGLLPGVNSFLNGLDYYENGVDFHLIGDEHVQQYIRDNEKALENVSFRLFFKSISDLRESWEFPSRKKGGWQVRFFRYRWAQKIRDWYEAILIVDADMICLNNLMDKFREAKETGLIIQPDNPVGYSLERIKEIGISPIRGASSPPFHNMPLFLDVRKWNSLLDRLWYWGIREDWGDMSTLFRTEFRENVLDQVRLIPNDLWLLEVFYKDMLRRVTKNGKIYLVTTDNREIRTVHKRWFLSDLCEKRVKDIKETDNYRRGKNNVMLFWEEFRRLNLEHKLKDTGAAKRGFSWRKPNLKPGELRS